MAQLVVRDFEDAVKVRLQRRAKRHRRSMEEEVREILRAAVGTEREGALRLGSRLRDRFAGVGLDEEISPLRGGKARAAAFGR
jgi:antitoxin FitA